jgi:hypothetical protein
MEITNILHYRRDEEAGKNITLSLRDLCLRDEYDIEAIFIAVRESIDTQDLLDRLRRLCYDPIEFDTETDKYIRCTVTDVFGNINYLKFKKKENK